jgi:UDP:flavonoid glycosyltransferase YjiC (YdhE family)
LDHITEKLPNSSQCCIPFFADHPYWGQRVAELGVGPTPIPIKKLTIDHLTQAIELAVYDLEMRQRVASLGSKIQAKDGIAYALRLLGQLE